MKSKRLELNLKTLGSAAGETHNPVDVLELKKSGKSKSRIGKKAIIGHLDPSYHRTIKMLSARDEQTIEDLLQIALDDLFLRKGIERI